MYQLPLIEKSVYQDTAFANNKKQPFHRWVNWIAGFSSSFVDQAIRRYLPKPSRHQTVLDPFGGVGTTPVTAYLRGHSVLAFEINPFPALVNRIKLRAIDELDPEQLYQSIKCFKQRMRKNRTPQSQPPVGFNTRIQFYSPNVLRKVLQVWDFINEIEGDLLKGVYQVAFGATMISFSNYTYEPSLTSRPGAGKDLIEDCDVTTVLATKLSEMHQDLLGVQDKKPPCKPIHEVVNGSFLDASLPPESIDLLITSPPYLNNYHYVRNTRPQLYWLGFAKKPADLHYLEENNYGKYWQTVRDSHNECSLLVDTPWIKALLKKISAVQQDRRIYGGEGWANYACEYFNDTLRFLQFTLQALKPKAKALIVVGNSILKGVDVPVDRVFAEIARYVGFSKVEIHVVRDKRVGSSIVGTGSRTNSKKNLYEVVVEIEK